MWLYLLVFSSDLLIAFTSVRYYYALKEQKGWQAIVWSMSLAALIGINTVGISIAKWHMIPLSVLGDGLGVALGLPRGKHRVS